MASNILYFTGAGASYNSIPTIKGNQKDRMDFGVYFKEFTQSVDKYQKRSNSKLTHVEKQINEFFKRNKLSIELVCNTVNEYGTPDTYAKSLFIKGNLNTVDYKNYKAVISLFFILWNLRKNSSFTEVDKRYLSLLSVLISGNGNGVLSFNERVKIVTWNYDNEIERAIFNYFLVTEKFNINSIRESLMITTPLINIPKPNIIKLNGSYSAFLNSDNCPFDYESLIYRRQDKKVNEMNVLSLLGATDIFNDVTPSLSFAWEHDLKKAQHIQDAKSIFVNADVLVVIGYSFPPFNREVDKLLIDAFLFSKKIRKNLKTPQARKKIYIQSTPDSVKEIEQRVIGLLKDDWENYVEIKLIDQVDEFYIPFEL